MGTDTFSQPAWVSSSTWKNFSEVIGTKSGSGTGRHSLTLATSAQPHRVSP